jgi:hypothetical protein
LTEEEAFARSDARGVFENIENESLVADAQAPPTAAELQDKATYHYQKGLAVHAKTAQSIKGMAKDTHNVINQDFKATIAKEKRFFK